MIFRVTLSQRFQKLNISALQKIASDGAPTVFERQVISKLVMNILVDL
jgi:hypothetical protein